MQGIEWLFCKRKVRFGDCDSAGVIHFHNLMRWAHESWEESLENYGIEVNDIFPRPSVSENNKVILPIIHCEAKFLNPIKLNDLLTIKLMPRKINNFIFKVDYYFFKEDYKTATASLVHCSISPHSRKRVLIPHKLELWIEASNIQNKVQEC